MAQAGSSKGRSVTHEEFIAKEYGGVRSRTSGASVTDKGDVRVRVSDDYSGSLFECKCTGGVGEKPVKSTLLKQMEKITDEAWSIGYSPALALRFYKPESPLADLDGWVDLTVRLTCEDADRGN